MISKDKPVGIDIEIVKSKIERVARKFLQDEELNFIDPDNRIEHLYICWCAKEAIYKLQGKRNVSFKDHIHLHPFSHSESGVLPASLQTDQECKSFEVYFEKFENYMIGYVACCEEIENTSPKSLKTTVDEK